MKWLALLLLVPTVLLADTDRVKEVGGRTMVDGDALVTGNLVVYGTSTLTILGTTTNDDATAGHLGEYVSSCVTAANYPVSTTYGDATSISLSAGDWDATINSMSDVNGTGFTDVLVGISTTTGNSSAGLIEGKTFMHFQESVNTAALARLPITLSNVRLSYAALTPVYFKFKQIAVGAQIYGCITARRIR